ncbi:hypothetical protein ACFVVU_20555 [Kitasatospora sp. NPDC057965]|uniref:hypothetical protein n=1 Tax=Kitasatospora sp. NPDC057965 TaxID=3346291 RepID=UPI0036D906EF
MGKWTAPGIARALTADVLGDRLLVKSAEGALLEPGRGYIEFPAVEKFGQFGF